VIIVRDQESKKKVPSVL
jgi:hypothetical protein